MSERLAASRTITDDAERQATVYATVCGGRGSWRQAMPYGRKKRGADYGNTLRTIH